MRIAILGGTGRLGAGLALRLSMNHEVLIGSRNLTRARDAASRLSRVAGKTIIGGLSAQVAGSCQAAILTIDYDSTGVFLRGLQEPLAGKLVISPIVPMKVEAGLFTYSKTGESASEQVAAILGQSRVAAAFHTVPAPVLLDTGTRLDLDVAVAADSRAIFQEAASIISSIDHLRPLYAGPLSQARTIERLVPLLLNLAKLNGKHNLSIKFV